ncbi:hypothetical protein HPB47_018590 [Ixodes persulcatus]|uniref:Uncharacterized protein n=1 Tax=Ixodes persulcatus TaxID=34615 RepID=A0AC60QKB8_IXOPE|nr:hypothetical protein HPB47_018590 [Ixodes persulcatus]
MEATTCPLGVKPEMVSIKTTKESNTITVLTESETTKWALLAIKEIQITDQQPLAVQAYEAIGDCQIRGVVYMIDKEEDNASLLAGLQSNGPAVLAARPMSSGSRTGLITFQGPHLPRTVWYRRNVLQVYPYRPRAVTCSNCHKIGHKQDICPEPQVCSTCGKPHEETMDDQGQVTCPSPIPFCQMCRKNGHLATDKYCQKRIDIVRRIRETARKRAAPLKNPGSSKPTKLVFQAKQKGGRRSTPPNPPAPTPTPPAPTATVDQVLPTMQGLFQMAGGSRKMADETGIDSPGSPVLLLTDAGWSPADKSEVLIQYAREHFAHPKICYDVLDIGSKHNVSDFVERYGEFDRVYSFFCLHWMRDQEAVLENVARLMKPGGECFLIFNASSPPMRFHKKLATMHRWEKYRKILEGPIPPSVGLETKEDLISYVKGLLKTAELTPKTCEVMTMEHKFASLEHLIDFQMAFNRLGRNIMEEERPLLLKDVTEECTKWWAEQEAGGSPLDGKVFMVRAHKPRSEAGSVVN